MKTYNIIVTGTVQGVFFRETTDEMAKALDIKGTVRNLQSGEVEIFAQSGDEKIKEFIEWCRKGPKYSKVEDISVTILENEEFDEFSIVF